MSGVTPHYGKWRARWTDHEGKRQSEVFDDKKDAELEEINRLLEAARAEGPMVRLIYLCASGTGMRQGELAGLKRTDVDFARRTICVQRSFNGPTKSGHIRYIPILDVIYDDLKHWIESHNNEFVFFNNAGNMLQPSARIFQEVFKRVLQRAGFDNILWNGRRKGYIVFHDLRHTFASHWVMGGGDIFKLKEILGHASIDMTMRYAHLAPHAFTADLSRLSFGVKKASLRLVQT